MDHPTAIIRLLRLIELRRQELYAHAKSLAESWFGRDAGAKFKTRFYVPDIRMRSGTSSGETISIGWKRRYPVNNWKGKLVTTSSGGKKLVKVMHQHVAARKTGLAFPRSVFKDASEVELAEILALEAELAPIRQELAFLGKSRRAVEDFYQKGGVQVEVKNWGDFPEIGAKATW